LPQILVSLDHFGSVVHRLIAELALDAQKSIVFGNPLRSAKGTGLDLSAACPSRQVSDKFIVGLTGAMSDVKR
jgi:hypothetical protein